ncbi:MAG: hypothetical protein JSS61_04460 [Verrucomicrobia bacterium]|nr:hypothetical protein [Verrucomicrobiota bacterium]
MTSQLLCNETVASAKPQVVQTKLSADEQSFAAKLSDENRHAFTESLSADQRKSVMVAFQNGANADEAVEGMRSAQAIHGEVAALDAE